MKWIRSFFLAAIGVTSVWAHDPAVPTLRAIRKLITPGGAVPDQPDGKVVNADSNFLYLLTGLADQAEFSSHPELWANVEAGLGWMARRQWREEDPLPGAFPDALPLNGPGLPLGAPPVAAVGATSARFVALVSRLPRKSPDLARAAKMAWESLRRYNLHPDGTIWNSWYQTQSGEWSRLPIRYAADQADLLAGLEGAVRLGFERKGWNPLQKFPLGALALGDDGQPVEVVDAFTVLGAWAVLAFDGDMAWKSLAMDRFSQSSASVLVLAAQTRLGDSSARQRLIALLRNHPMPPEWESGSEEVNSNVAGFVLRALAGTPKKSQVANRSSEGRRKRKAG